MGTDTRNEGRETKVDFGKCVLILTQIGLFVNFYAQIRAERKILMMRAVGIHWSKRIVGESVTLRKHHSR
ncbi:hypothetical protein HSB1_06690 [Halogranum salarium B-1]|uniref:Uncharacterized protein n=1 Tax=Halogranum salarium B-1 TaxID=1210908 RepID=J3A7M8_9EURY|nr:hypothetical protein HSB1_06690 [Halogranum salarium B-1]